MAATAVPLDELSEEGVLQRAELCAEAVREAEVVLLRVAYAWAVLHDPARLDPAETGKPGREQASGWRGGG